MTGWLAFNISTPIAVLQSIFPSEATGVYTIVHLLFDQAILKQAEYIVQPIDFLWLNVRQIDNAKSSAQKRMKTSNP